MIKIFFLAGIYLLGFIGAFMILAYSSMALVIGLQYVLVRWLI